MVVHDAPGPERAVEVAADAIDGDAVLSLLGRCTVDFAGRADGHLDAGDRLVVVKPDGTTLVHAASGRQPAAWLPPGEPPEPGVADGEFVLAATRERGDSLRVQFAALGSLAVEPVEVEGDREVSGTEADLRRRVLDDPALVEEGFQPLAVERPTPAGRVDVFGEDADGAPVAVELKRRRVGPSAVSQLARYVDALAADLHADATVRGLLVAPSLTPQARRRLRDRDLEFVSLWPKTE